MARVSLVTSNREASGNVPSAYCIHHEHGENEMISQNDQRPEGLALIIPAEMEQVQGGGSSFTIGKDRTTNTEPYLTFKLDRTFVKSWSTSG
jgi:hypothetical protein